MDNGVFLLRVKWMGHAADHSPPFRAITTYVILLGCLLKHGHKFILQLLVVYIYLGLLQLDNWDSLVTQYFGPLYSY